MKSLNENVHDLYMLVKQLEKTYSNLEICIVTADGRQHVAYADELIVEPDFVVIEIRSDSGVIYDVIRKDAIVSFKVYADKHPKVMSYAKKGKFAEQVPCSTN